MYFDANQLANGALVTGYDICIVGAGAAGIALAARLVGGTKKVLLISNGSSSASAAEPPPMKPYTRARWARS